MSLHVVGGREILVRQFRESPAVRLSIGYDDVTYRGDAAEAVRLLCDALVALTQHVIQDR